MTWNNSLTTSSYTTQHLVLQAVTCEPSFSHRKLTVREANIKGTVHSKIKSTCFSFCLQCYQSRLFWGESQSVWDIGCLLTSLLNVDGQKIHLKTSTAMSPSRNHDPATQDNLNTLLWAVRSGTVSFPPKKHHRPHHHIEGSLHLLLAQLAPLS